MSTFAEDHVVLFLKGPFNRERFALPARLMSSYLAWAASGSLAATLLDTAAEPADAVTSRSLIY